MIITNKHDIPLALAVWVMFDEYDYVKDNNYISATGLMKPLRQIILSDRVPKEDRIADVEDFIASAVGKSFHDSIEKAWVQGHRLGLKKLGYPDSVIDRVLVNPTPEQLAAVPDAVPVYLEQREKREIDGYIIGGKYDMIAEGIVHDNKSTTTFAWTSGTRDDDYKLQGSIYRWLNPDKISEDFIRINFIFTDWQKFQAKTNPNYPQRRLISKDIPLMSIEETEAWIRWKIAQVDKYKNSPEKDIPECTDEELWRSSPQYKYYSDPNKTDGKSTKNFDDPIEARKYQAEKGKGVIITKPGEVKRCGYCPAFPVCTQKDRYNLT